MKQAFMTYDDIVYELNSFISLKKDLLEYDFISKSSKIPENMMSTIFNALGTNNNAGNHFDIPFIRESTLSLSVDGISFSMEVDTKCSVTPGDLLKNIDNRFSGSISIYYRSSIGNPLRNFMYYYSSLSELIEWLYMLFGEDSIATTEILKAMKNIWQLWCPDDASDYQVLNFRDSFFAILNEDHSKKVKNTIIDFIQSVMRNEYDPVSKEDNETICIKKSKNNSLPSMRYSIIRSDQYKTSEDYSSLIKKLERTEALKILNDYVQYIRPSNINDFNTWYNLINTDN